MQWSLGRASRDDLFYAFVDLLYLWLFADNVEDRMGHKRFAAFCTLCAAASATMHAVMKGVSPFPFVLTSGAVAGVLGAYVVLYPRSRVLMFFPVPMRLVEIPAGVFLTLFLALHLPAGVVTVAHMTTGFLAGALLCVAFRRPVTW